MYKNFPDENRYRRKAAQLKLIYAFALSFIALSMITSSIILFISVEHSSGDARMINLSGRQRMLSQRITKCILAVSVLENKDASDAYMEELRFSLGEWIKAHKGLQQGDASLGLPAGGRSVEIRELFKEIAPYHDTIVSAIRQFLDSPDAASSMKNRMAMANLCSKPMLENQKQFLIFMDKITFQFDMELQRKIAQMKRIEIAVLAIGLLLLLFEFLVIFRPTLAQVHTVIVDLSIRNTQLAESERSLTEAKNAREKIIMLIGHDLKGAFSTVLAGVKLLSNRDVSPVDENTIFKSLNRNVDNTHQLLEDILNWMRKQDDGERTVIEIVDMQKVVQECVSIYSDAIAGKNLTVENRIGAGESVKTDRFILETILRNLINNAVKFTSNGGKISLFTEISNANKIIVVADTGVGIAPDKLKDLFTLGYSHSQNGTNGETGTGLGLMMCREFAEKIGAVISVESRLGEGSVFKIALPLE